jgi:hypothetical protein
VSSLLEFASSEIILFFLKFFLMDCYNLYVVIF